MSKQLFPLRPKQAYPGLSLEKLLGF